MEGVYANGFLRLTNHPAHDLPLEIGEAPDLRGVVVPALLSQPQSPAWPWFLTPTVSIDGWGTIPAGPLAGCWAGVSPSIVILAEPESSRTPKAGFNALKRNWLRQLPVNLRPDEVRRLHALSKQRRWPIARIVTEAVREALDQDREGRWR
ncbi:MAG: hypothetical protein EA402_00030 [Planctomycetota bacterium]|nr:MAG: hypothetical protein EA402_00030 [Planctomycetota bacterium]